MDSFQCMCILFMCNTPNNVCWRRGKDYFMNPLNQIHFYKNLPIFVDPCMLLKHWVPCIQFMTPASLQTFSTNLSSCSASCIWMFISALVVSFLREHAIFPYTFQFLNTLLSPTVPAILSLCVICKFNNYPFPVPKSDPVYFGSYMNAE